MTQPTVVFQDYPSWIAARPGHAITALGTIQTDPTIDSSIQGGIASVWYDQVANQLCVDNVS